ncbi:MAG: hypothetical protein ACW96X_12815 [Promethearchaeota archaeon]|jgi:hypothetical protein
MDKKKLIGALLMLPLPVLLLTLVLKTDFWVYLILVTLATFAFSYGFKLLKGASLDDIKKEVIKDLDDVNDEVKDLKK